MIKYNHIHFKAVLAFIFLLSLTKMYGQKFSEQKAIAIEPEEHWWGGVVRDGHMMPFDPTYSFNMFGDNKGNQIQPLLVSDHGRVIWSENPIEFVTKDGQIVISSSSEIILSKAGTSLKDAFQFASSNYFPSSGKTPDELLFTSPQYNTWIELIYDQNQVDILNYANKIITNGFPPGVIMIDDNWQEDYGKWYFHQGRFENPKAMIDSLHGMGFKVMMWICPFVSPDSDVYRDLSSKGLFLKEADGVNPLIVRWWNGASAVLDFTNPGAVDWFSSQLRFLSETYGVDGFKLDAGDSYFYNQPSKSFIPEATPNDHTLSFQQFGLEYPLNEYRATWKMGGQPLAQRLHDKGHNWDDLQVLIPQMLLQGLIGYPFSCPDMIGGGDYGSFINLDKVDQELIVRSAQVHALMPMMQFSVAPWRILDDEHFQAIKQSVAIREKYLPVIMDLVQKAASDGTPIVRMMEYEFPGQGYHLVKDQFMLGKDLLIAPVLENGAEVRNVVLPQGKWVYKNKVYKGGKTITVNVGLADIPVFFRK